MAEQKHAGLQYVAPEFHSFILTQHIKFYKKLIKNNIFCYSFRDMFAI
jgi:hypothetical protein